MNIKIHSIKETKELAQNLASLIQGKNIVICLSGDLGAGKTTWTQAFGKALGVKKTINSPTFTIMKNYVQGDDKPFFHIDAYRLEGLDQDLGFEECFDEGICVIEWSHFIENQIPSDHIEMNIFARDGELRTIELLGTGPVSQEIVKEYENA